MTLKVFLRKQRPGVKQRLSPSGGGQTISAAASRSREPTAAPMASRASDTPPLALTRHVHAEEDALGRGKLGFQSPGLSENQQVGKQRRQPSLHRPQKRHQLPLAGRHCGDGCLLNYRKESLHLTANLHRRPWQGPPTNQSGWASLWQC